MFQKKILQLFEELDLLSLRTYFEIVDNDRFLNNEFSIGQKVNDYFLDVQFKVQWEFENDLFILTDVLITDITMSSDLKDEYIISDYTLVKIEKILTNKINQLT